MRKAFVLLVFLMAATAVLASSGANYKSSPEGLLMGTGNASGSAYASQISAGETTTCNASGAAYSSLAGFLVSSVTYSTQETGVPIISNLKFDGRSIVSGDYVNSNVTITATITDSATAIDTNTSSIEINSASHSFSGLSGNSSFDATTGSLTYRNATVFPSGTHTLKIIARDTAGNSSSVTINFTVDSGELNIVNGTVFNFPNPFNPAQTATEIGYRLNADANIAVYLFNSLGQMVWKRTYAAGSEGAHAGYNALLWDGKSDFGEVAGNGIYFCRIVADGKVIGRTKIAVLK